MKTALITGITGQDGAYLARLLLGKGYQVVGLVRRSSTSESRTERLRRLGIAEQVELIDGDITDLSSLCRAVRSTKPDEVYNLAAQSFVGSSWNQPLLTAEVTGFGAANMLEALRLHHPTSRFYQASSSEMFGGMSSQPQNEDTPFHPRSPYGVAKAFAHYLTVNYRESFGMHASCGILFNHECLAESTPLLVRKHGMVDVVTPDELVPRKRKGAGVQIFNVAGVDVWDGADWTPITAITASRRRTANDDQRMISIEARGGVVEATAHHKMLTAALEEVAASELAEGSSIALGELPEMPNWSVVTPELAEFLGMMCADGYIDDRGHAQFTNNDESLRARVAMLWRVLFLGFCRVWFVPSGFDADRMVGQLALTGANAAGRWVREQIYTSSGHKRVPQIVLNSQPSIQVAFLKGHYAGDGLKSGNGDRVKTNSTVLAQGLCWLYAKSGRRCSVYVEHRGGRRYYTLNVATADPQGAKGQHLRKDPREVRRVHEVQPTSEWVYDIETESGVFCAGVGRVIVHNSPLRGIEFVTRKITDGVARIKLGLVKELRLGNVSALRDWGHADDYVRAMWLMLQKDVAGDYVIATGRSASVRKVCEIAFYRVGLNVEDYLVTDKALTRPAEVHALLGDSTKARSELGWEPQYTLEDTINEMVDADMKLLSHPVKEIELAA